MPPVPIKFTCCCWGVNPAFRLYSKFYSIYTQKQDLRSLEGHENKSPFGTVHKTPRGGGGSVLRALDFPGPDMGLRGSQLTSRFLFLFFLLPTKLSIKTNTFCLSLSFAWRLRRLHFEVLIWARISKDRCFRALTVRQVTKAFNCLLTLIALDKTLSFPVPCQFQPLQLPSSPLSRIT